MGLLIMRVRMNVMMICARIILGRGVENEVGA